LSHCLYSLTLELSLLPPCLPPLLFDLPLHLPYLTLNLPLHLAYFIPQLPELALLPRDLVPLLVDLLNQLRIRLQGLLELPFDPLVIRSDDFDALSLRLDRIVEPPDVLVEGVRLSTGRLQVCLDGRHRGAEVPLEGILGVSYLLTDLFYPVEEKVLSQIGGLISIIYLRFSHRWYPCEEGPPMAERVWSPVQHLGVRAELFFIDLIIDFAIIISISIIGRSRSLLAYTTILVRVLIGDSLR
jgi:hypothetical protein